MFMASPILNAVCLLIVEITDKDVPQLTSATHHMYVLKSSFAYRTSSSFRPRPLDFPESEFHENEVEWKHRLDEAEGL